MEKELDKDLKSGMEREWGNVTSRVEDVTPEMPGEKRG
jgi:hypothetical protein